MKIHVQSFRRYGKTGNAMKRRQMNTQVPIVTLASKKYDRNLRCAYYGQHLGQVKIPEGVEELWTEHKHEPLDLWSQVWQWLERGFCTWVLHDFSKRWTFVAILMAEDTHVNRTKNVLKNTHLNTCVQSVTLAFEMIRVKPLIKYGQDGDLCESYILLPYTLYLSA